MPFLRVLIPSLLALQLGIIALLFIATALFGQDFQGRNELVLTISGLIIGFLITLFALFYVRRGTPKAYIVSGLAAAPICLFIVWQIAFPIWFILGEH